MTSKSISGSGTASGILLIYLYYFFARVQGPSDFDARCRQEEGGCETK